MQSFSVDPENITTKCTYHILPISIFFFVADSGSSFNHCDVTGLKITELSEIAQNNGDYVVQNHSRSPTLVPMESPYAPYYVSVIVTYLVSCIVSEIRLIIRTNVAVDSRTPIFHALALVNPYIQDCKAKFDIQETRNIPLS